MLNGPGKAARRTYAKVDLYDRNPLKSGPSTLGSKMTAYDPFRTFDARRRWSSEAKGVIEDAHSPENDQPS
jgi:hypothetical protein